MGVAAQLGVAAQPCAEARAASTLKPAEKNESSSQLRDPKRQAHLTNDEIYGLIFFP